MQSQSDALGQVAGGPILGWIATAVSLSAAFVVAGILLMPAVALFAWAARRDHQERTLLAAEASPGDTGDTL
jgi:uncharacterized membrane protein